MKRKKYSINGRWRVRLGFTIIEVALFIAITGALFVGITVGTANSIQHQRFYDSVQTFAEFLRSVYSQVSNPQSVGDGRSEEAIYGKLITFGETVGLDGKDVNTYSDTAQRIYVYDVVGDVIGTGTGSAQKLLSDVNANVVRVVEWEDGKPKRIETAGETQVFIPRWGASIETTEILTTAQKDAGRNNLYEGSILVVRNPRSGTINTLVSAETIPVNAMVRDFNEGTRAMVDFNEAEVYAYQILLKKYLSLSGGVPQDQLFYNREVDFCVNPSGDMVGTDYRWNVRLINNARNSSGVEVIDLDLDEVVGGEQAGNRCRFAA